MKTNYEKFKDDPEYKNLLTKNMRDTNFKNWQNEQYRTKTLIQLENARKKYRESGKVLKGKYAPTYDHTIYNFYHVSGEIFTGTQYEFRMKYELNSPNVSNLVRGVRLQHKGWKVVLNNND